MGRKTPPVTTSGREYGIGVLQLLEDIFLEEFLCAFGRNREELVVPHDAHPLLTLAHAEGAGKFHFVFQMVFTDQFLNLQNDLTRTLQMAGATDASSDFHDFFLRIYLFICVNAA